MTESPAGNLPVTAWGRLLVWARRVGAARRFAVLLAALAAASGIATYIVLTRPSAFGPDPNTVLILVNVNLALLLALAVVVVRRVVQLWAERRRGSAGSRLHVRLVVLFSAVAATPAVVVAVFSVMFLNFGMQSWFSESVRNALGGSLDVANAYLDEQSTITRSDVQSMAEELAREYGNYPGNRLQLEEAVKVAAGRRGLSDAMVLDRKGTILARTGYAFSLEMSPVSVTDLERAAGGEVRVFVSDDRDRLRALISIEGAGELFLYAGRFVQPGVLKNVKRVSDAILVFEQLEGRRARLQLNFAMLFAVLSLLLLLSAMWIGLTFAGRLTRPISSLISATERVRAGDLTVRVEGTDEGDEIGTLARAFNRMTSQIESQRAELVEANRQLELRRRFTEAVLGGVSAGVIGMDAVGRITLPNRPASTLLETDLDRAVGRALAEVVPEMASLLDEAVRQGRGLVEGEVRVVRGRRAASLLVRVTVERGEREVLGFVATFDDVTELQSAQRKAAWADVARRIAHEIKNPLTPIQLSAERLKRKYLKEIVTEPEIFVQCTDTIVRQVGDIGRMVDEFSGFARMPAPNMRSENLGELCRQAIFVQRTASPDIEIAFEAPEAPVARDCDASQIGQALANLLKNAAESIAARKGDGALGPGMIAVRLAADEGMATVVVEDNGIGFPAEQRDRLTEPYVTTRAKGTGLGLAIVRKIMEDHGGMLSLEDREGGGARACLSFPAERERVASPGVPEVRHGA